MKKLKSLKDIDLKALSSGKKYHPSPDAWEDQVMYFLLADRFSDGKEKNYYDLNKNIVEKGEHDLYDPEKDFEEAVKNGREEWESWADKWNGGNLKGIISKLGYLKRLGITTIWISPIFRQTAFDKTYHGYGIQDFLDIDPHFGSPEDLRELVKLAHENDLYVILDIVVNHSGNVFSYKEEAPQWSEGKEYDVEGFNDANGNPSIAAEDKKALDAAFPEGAVWPAEMQHLENYTRQGSIQNWDSYPEYVQGDFYSFKNHYLGKGDGDDFEASNTLRTLVKVFKYWISFADIDGYRLDTVKHMEAAATRYFAAEIHKFAKSLGKDNFYIIGEITGGLDFAYEMLEKTGLDASQGLNQIPEKMENTVKGFTSAGEYFSEFKNDKLFEEGEDKWFRDKVLTMFDDQDMVSKGDRPKARFCANKETASLIHNVLFLNVCSLGIPCIYYGSEQGFDGSGKDDRHIREAMFGGGFGAFRTSGLHFFNEDNPIYKEISNILKVRTEHIILRQGRQYLREISYDGKNFGLPQKTGDERMKGLIAWSRIFENEEYVLALNTELDKVLEALVVVDSQINSEDDVFECLYISGNDPIGKKMKVRNVDQKKVISLKVPQAGCVIYRKMN